MTDNENLYKAEDDALKNGGNDSSPAENTPKPEMPDDGQPSSQDDLKEKKKKHAINPRWLRITLKTFGWLLLFIILLPVLLYIPPVQTFVKNFACSFVYKSTGMKIDIDRFRLRFPVDVELDGVTVLYASGDTMARVGKAVAEVKLLPLLKLDIDLNKLQLENGYYKMVSPDSSMIMSIDAGFLNVDGGSSMSLSSNEILLNKALLRNGKVNLMMDVWKQQKTPADSTSTPFLIKAGYLDVENISFTMSMLPTIDSLAVNAGKLRLKHGVIDLRTNSISLAYASIDGGDATYIMPTAEYIAAHPAPVDTTPSGPPMIIKGDSISVDNFKALYATKGAKPLPGFDAAYISVDDVAVGMRNFYNEASTIRLPITRLQAKERSGLQIVEGRGTVGVDSTGLTLDALNVATLYSKVKATAGIPFALMELKPDAKMNCQAEGHIGIPDVEAFMPDLKTYTKMLSSRRPLDFNLDANGSIKRLLIDRLEARMAGVISLDAEGYAEDPLDVKKLRASLDFDGSLEDPSMVDRILGKSPVRIPKFRITGYAEADRGDYSADFDLLTDAGDLAAKGNVNMNSEGYTADLSAQNIDVDYFMPGMGIGKITAKITADGAGFNPLTGKARTDARINLASIEVNHNVLRDIEAKVMLDGGTYDLSAVSGNPDLDLYMEGNGTVAPDNYTFDIVAKIKNADIQKLGFSPTVNNGHGDIYLKGSASPERWLYDADLTVNNLDWNLPGQYIHLPGGATAKLLAKENMTEVHVESSQTNLDFTSATGLKRVVDGFSVAAVEMEKQLKMRQLSIDTLRDKLPPFDLALNASGKGLLSQFLNPSGMGIDTVYAHLANDSIIYGNVGVLGLNTGSMTFDTITLNLKERGHLLDYIARLGNRKGNLDEFAKVTARGYVGDNRASMYVNQFNSEGKNGYRIGMTAAFVDSLITLHFTPLKATIAYLPWTLNDDNYIEYNLNGRLQANLLAKSSESSLLIQTEPLENGRNELHLKMDNIHIQDFLSLSVFAPPITASVNSDIKIRYDGHDLSGNGTLGVKNFTYDKLQVGDFDMDLDAGMMADGSSRATLGLMIDGKPAMNTTVRLVNDSTGLEPEEVKLNLTGFPLKVANPFIGANVASLSGKLNGEMTMDGTFSKPILNGYILCDTVGVYIPMSGTKLKFAQDSLTVVDNIVKFKDFEIFALNKNPLIINGTVDATSFSAIGIDMAMDAKNIQLVGNDKRGRTDIYGKLFMDLNATAKGNLDRLDIRANAGILSATDVAYVLSTAASAVTDQTDSDVVKFVNFNDTTQVAKADSVKSTMNMRIVAQVNIEPGTEVQVDLSNNGTDRVQLSPSGTLNYFQNYMGDMRLNGQLNIGNGFARYAIPVVGERSFTFNPDSYVLWNGDILNPQLNIHATDLMKANVSNSGNARLVNFLVAANVTNNLSAPKLTFDLSTNDDLDIQNELESMSADQRSTQAMNLLLYGQYTGPNTKANANISGNMLYSFLESQLNSWAANHIRGVDLSFGIDQYDKTRDGNTSTTTSYSYQVSKSLFNNRFKILVGGNYSTDASADENFAENLISDISFEYILKQTQTLNMAVKLYRHTGYESILEGEITETGVGFVMKRKMGSLRRLFHFLRRKKKTDDDAEISADSIATRAAEAVKEAVLKEEETEKQVNDSTVKE